ncbi:hypothetical protein [Polyangium spumosum]|uniref:Uncharacterized protein n=1 Tax=Polyangium spumosum TaxID=889282 RepID=A0A6N7Q186_9BACT|nr:hypothetical protein [Polyangium spumosum]MRG98053.1 hypothetical protein [Polyangium spumosum]
MSETKKAPELLHVALLREADDLRALHKLIGLRIDEDPWEYWDTTGVALPSAVESLLGVCGFGGKAPPVPEVRVLDETGVNAVPMMGFTVPAAEYGAVRAALMASARGQIGGFSPIVVALSGFHDAAIDVFAHVWSLSGRPRVWVRSAALGTRGSAESAPQSLLPFAGRDPSFSASSYIRSLARAAGG